MLFGNEERNYYINIVGGIRRNTDEKGFLLLNQFKAKHEGGEVEVFKDTFYKTPSEAVCGGIDKMKDVVNLDFQEYRDRKEGKACARKTTTKDD